MVRLFAIKTLHGSPQETFSVTVLLPSIWPVSFLSMLIWFSVQWSQEYFIHSERGYEKEAGQYRERV